MSKVLLALVLVAAVWGDLVDDDSPGDMELMYPEQNYVDMIPEPEPGPGPSAPARSDFKGTALQPTSQPRKYEYPNGNMRRILMYKMLQALRNHDASPSILSVPKWTPTDTVPFPLDTYNFSHLKEPLEPMFKRYSPDGSTKGAKLNVRLQQKWKIKKGRAGPQIICYFKLCAFRPST